MAEYNKKYLWNFSRMTFNRLIYILKGIKEFIADISNIHSFRKYPVTFFVKEKFQKLTNDYDVTMEDLHFTIIISKEQRKIEFEAMKEDIDEMANYFNVNKIDSKDLTSPEQGKSDESDNKRCKHNEILSKLSECSGICNGLIFLQYTGILHHDLKCENILIIENFKSKIHNFELACYSDGNTISLPIDLESEKTIIPWLASEKLYNSQYTTQCEIFSFGMLLWELTFEKIPYEAWKQNPQEHISFMKLSKMLEELCNSIYMSDNNSLSNKSLNLDGSKEMLDILELLDENIYPIIIKQAISLEEGIQAFKIKNIKRHEYSSKIWKDRYLLWEGYLDIIKEQYLKKAAIEGNSTAQFNLSDIS
ncbi:kinase-like domain-containing protein [Glomus cerebriforme]|uniref:Kinase-like domain-containing protein n=1 Tax=Glomus cerebriforme TaxID=658196 RepID=A0A397SN22_9GLOM|nr:kinase-like domain-containing protein [Glomus cerebriforme]